MIMNRRSNGKTGRRIKKALAVASIAALPVLESLITGSVGCGGGEFRTCKETPACEEREETLTLDLGQSTDFGGHSVKLHSIEMEGNNATARLKFVDACRNEEELQVRDGSSNALVLENGIFTVTPSQISFDGQEATLEFIQSCSVGTGGTGGRGPVDETGGAPTGGVEETGGRSAGGSAGQSNTGGAAGEANTGGVSGSAGETSTGGNETGGTAGSQNTGGNETGGVSGSGNAGGAGTGGVSTGGSAGNGGFGGVTQGGSAGTTQAGNGGAGGAEPVCEIHNGTYESIIFSVGVPKVVGGIEFTITEINTENIVVDAVCGLDENITGINVPTDGSEVAVNLQSGGSVTINRLSNSDTAARLTFVIM